MERYFHGENGITFSLFSELKDSKAVQNLVKNCQWQKNSIPKISEKVQIHLFPSFGRGFGAGEPDFIIISEGTIIIGEVETDSVKKLCSHFFKQIANFEKLGNYFSETTRKQIKGKAIVEKNFKFKGKHRTRKVFKEINLESVKKVHFLVITNDRPKSESQGQILKTRGALIDALDSKGIKSDLLIEKLGWIGLPSLMRLKDLPQTKATIKFNLKN